jgi:hypothetical protein
MPTTLSHPLKVAEIRSRIELDLKEEATRVLASCGLNVSDANKDRYKYCLYQIWLFNGNSCSL